MKLILPAQTVFSWRRFSGFATLFMAAGIGLVLVSRASVPLAAIEPETGTLSSCAVAIPISGASGGVAVSFASCMDPTPAPTATPPPTADGCTLAEPIGGGMSAYSSLSGATFSARVNSAPASNTVSLATSTYSFSDFADTVAGVQTGASITGSGLVGSGIDRSILQMAPASSTKAASVPTAAGTTNQLYLMAFTKSGLHLDCFTLAGTHQGHLYNGIRLSQVTGAVLSNLKLVGTSPGNSYIPPGETFAINDYRGTNNAYTNVEIDGQGTGATAFGSNSSVGGVWTDDYAHDHQYSAGIALWQMTGTMTLTRFRSVNNRVGINLERVNGTVNITQPTLMGNTAHDLFIGNDQGSTKINIYDPILSPGQKIRIHNAGLEQGNPNLQVLSDIKVYVNGVDSTASMVVYN
jgi:MOSC domain-containing protein YiiM